MSLVHCAPNPHPPLLSSCEPEAQLTLNPLGIAWRMLTCWFFLPLARLSATSNQVDLYINPEPKMNQPFISNTNISTKGDNTSNKLDNMVNRSAYAGFACDRIGPFVEMYLEMMNIMEIDQEGEMVERPMTLGFNHDMEIYDYHYRFDIHDDQSDQYDLNIGDLTRNDLEIDPLCSHYLNLMCGYLILEKQKLTIQRIEWDITEEERSDHTILTIDTLITWENLVDIGNRHIRSRLHHTIKGSTPHTLNYDSQEHPR